MIQLNMERLPKRAILQDDNETVHVCPENALRLEQAVLDLARGVAELRFAVGCVDDGRFVETGRAVQLTLFDGNGSVRYPGTRHVLQNPHLWSNVIAKAGGNPQAICLRHLEEVAVESVLPILLGLESPSTNLSVVN